MKMTAQAPKKRRLLPEQKPGRVKARPVRNGVITLGLMAAVLFFMYSQGTVPFLPKGGETVTAEFASSANVTPGKTPVRVRGVEVGIVEEVERRPGADGVRIKMRLEKQLEDFELKKDARADILWRTLLGFAFYIELDPGSAPEALGDDAIPMDRTTTQVELDQVLASVDKPSREGLQTLFREFDTGFNGSSPAGRSIDALAPSMRQVAPGVDALRGVRSGDLTQTVRDANKLMAAVGRNEQDLGELLTNASTTLGVTAARRADIGGTLRNGPQTLADTTATMRRTRATLDALDPVAQRLRPGVRVLDDASRAVRPALDGLTPLLADARPTLRDLRPALTSLRRAASAGTPFLRDLDVPLQRTNETIIPGLREKESETELQVASLIGPVFATVADSSSLFDANGFTQRFNAVAAGERSASFLPCTSNIYKQEVSCNDVETVIEGALGIAPGASKSRVRLTETPQSRSTASPARQGSRPAGAVEQAAKTLKGIL